MNLKKKSIFLVGYPYSQSIDIEYFPNINMGKQKISLLHKMHSCMIHCSCLHEKHKKHDYFYLARRAQINLAPLSSFIDTSYIYYYYTWSMNICVFVFFLNAYIMNQQKIWMLMCFVISDLNSAYSANLTCMKNSWASLDVSLYDKWWVSYTFNICI